MLLAALCLTLLDSSRSIAGEKTLVVINISMGTIKAELFADKAPDTVDNFLKYVDAKFYDGTIFHRVVPKFVIQGGGYDANMKKKETRGPIKNEASKALKNEEGTLAMARTSDPDSATSQFFISLKDNKSLDHRDKTRAGIGYAVFGKVIEGMDVVKKIADVRTTRKRGMANVPETSVVIESIRRSE